MAKKKKQRLNSFAKAAPQTAASLPNRRLVMPFKFAAAYFLAALTYLFLFSSALEAFYCSLAATALMLGLLSFWWGGSPLSGREFRPANISVGVMALSLLYILTALGARLLKAVYPPAAGQITGFYAWLDGINPVLVVLLAIFVIGPGLELFWRGFIQRWLTLSWDGKWGCILSIFASSFVFLPSLNFTLICGGLLLNTVCGLLYFWRRAVFPSMFVHGFWLATVLYFFPL